MGNDNWRETLRLRRGVERRVGLCMVWLSYGSDQDHIGDLLGYASQGVLSTVLYYMQRDYKDNGTPTEREACDNEDIVERIECAQDSRLSGCLTDRHWGRLGHDGDGGGGDDDCGQGGVLACRSEYASTHSVGIMDWGQLEVLGGWGGVGYGVSDVVWDELWMDVLWERKDVVERGERMRWREGRGFVWVGQSRRVERWSHLGRVDSDIVLNGDVNDTHLTVMSRGEQECSVGNLGVGAEGCGEGGDGWGQEVGRLVDDVIYELLHRLGRRGSGLGGTMVVRVGRVHMRVVEGGVMDSVGVGVHYEVEVGGLVGYWTVRSVGARLVVCDSGAWLYWSQDFCDGVRDMVRILGVQSVRNIKYEESICDLLNSRLQTAFNVLSLYINSTDDSWLSLYIRTVNNEVDVLSMYIRRSTYMKQVRVLVGSPEHQRLSSYSPGSSSTRIYFPGASTTLIYSLGSSSTPIYSPGASRDAECSNCKHLLDKITVLEAMVEMSKTDEWWIRDSKMDEWRKDGDLGFRHCWYHGGWFNPKPMPL
ncbi:hypothetical protein Tco_0104395 [Tanacetum coccineum]